MFILPTLTVNFNFNSLGQRKSTMTVAVHWFRNGLRLHDNPALLRAAKDAEKLILLYIFDEKLLSE